MTDFTHLHVHSWFSFGQGVSSPATLVEAAAARGYTTLACTDTNGVYGAIDFQQAALAAGIRPILGAQLVSGAQEAVVLATNAKGWAALCRAVTAIHWAPPEPPNLRPSDRPTVLLSAQLATDRDGLLVLTRDIPLLERLVQLSGPGGLYAELRPGRERHAVGAAAKRLGVPAVVTGGVMFAHPEDAALHRLRVAIHHNTTLDAGAGGLGAARDDRTGRIHAAPALDAGAGGLGAARDDRTGRIHAAPTTPRATATDAWLRPAADMARHFPDCPDALTRSHELAAQCEYRIPVGQRTIAPRADTDALPRLRALAYAGAERRYGTIAPVTRDRLEHELAIIAQKHFADYFLVVHDIVQHGSTHCGRGSVANSIVSYCLGITHVDPLGAGLLFERFLNPERKDPPDIDLDFPWDERDQILAYVFRTYPLPRAAMVANHNCFRVRGALREVAKVHGRPPGEIREITRRFPWFSDDTALTELLATHPNFQGLDLPRVWQDLARLAQPLIGMPRHLSLHPGGVVIVPGALTDYVPLERATKTLDGHPDLPVPVIQFEKDGAEDAGLVKIDLLGNRSLAVIRDAIEAVRVRTGRQIDYTTSDPEEDEPTRALFRTGQTMGVFYTESPASRMLCAKSRADTFELLVLNTSIIRPASNRYIRVYLERLHGAPYVPLDPVLRDTLAETFGVMVFQEDVVNVCAAFAGMPLSTGDGLRKALSKKRPTKQLAAYAGEFFAGAAALGRDPEVAVKVWEMVLSFSGYSFCKGHSCSYIRVAQHACYLRAHYPAEFIAAVLANGGGFYRPFAYVAEAMRMGLTVRPPDVNASVFRTTGQDGEVRIGFQFITGLSNDAIDRIARARPSCSPSSADQWVRTYPSSTPSRADQWVRAYPSSTPSSADQWVRAHPSSTPSSADQWVRTYPSSTPFVSFDDFRARTKLRPDDLRLLVKVGACDAIGAGMTRPMMLWAVDAEQREGGRGNGEGEMAKSRSLFPVPRSPGAPPTLREYDTDRRRRAEYELLGFTTDIHPMRLYAEELARFRIVRSTALHQHVGRTVLCAGMLTTAKPVHTITEEPMEFATFDDGDGLIETVLFPAVYHARGHVLFDMGPFIFRGKVEQEFGAVTVTILQLDRLERMVEKVGEGGAVGSRR